MLQSKKTPDPICEIEHYERRISLFLQELRALGITIEPDEDGFYQTDFDINQLSHPGERQATILRIRTVNDLRGRIKKLSENK